MDKPARFVVAAVETCPVQPEAPPLLVLDPIIIADRVPAFAGIRSGAFRPPPFVGDPLRPIGAHDPMPAAPPHESERRIVRQQPERLDRLRRLEQSYRPAPTLPLRGSFPPPCPWGRAGVGARCRHSHRGALRNVALARLKPRYCGETEPVAEPVEEQGDAAR